jgi:DNA-binding response OmpR family regulator
MLVTPHDDTAELYRFALERAGYAVERCRTPQEALEAGRHITPLAIVVHFTPRENPAAIGAALRSLSLRTVLVGLFSIQLQMSALRQVLETFDDVIMIPCTPDALVARVVGLEERKQKQASA